jgi:hypothetical protein
VRRAARAVALTLVALAGLGGCGAQAPDLFAVQRTGAGANARLRMVVSDAGSVTCNGREHPIASNTLLRARKAAKDLADPAQLHLTLPPGERSELSYRVQTEDGTVSFSDTSAHLPPAFTEVELLTKDISEDVCGITR